MNLAFEWFFRYLIIFSSFFFNEQKKMICHCQNANPTPPPDAQKDAKVIVDSKFDPSTIAKILPYRTKEECQAINGAIASLNGGKNLVPPDYEPLKNTSAYQDLLFALVNDVLTVFSKYMGRYLDLKDETMIIMIYAQIDDREGFKHRYDDQHKRCFDDARRDQRHPFANSLKVWSEYNRCPNSDYPSLYTCTYGINLFGDRKNWDDRSRRKLEDALMILPGDQSKGILYCYGKDKETPQPSIIKDIHNHIHNDDLKDLYTTLVRYIQDANDYLAEKLHDYCDGRDNWAMWIIVVTRCREDTKGLDESFQKRYNGVTLKQYLDVRVIIQDPVLKNIRKK
ncbi:uncharacterized protein LOC135848628 [Planococcus citri]|uniref:uncharacterized protein LOC135848628 n=1 Tax=Planococcus citri TaxID=170843 RepID=UPI0031F940BB